MAWKTLGEMKRQSERKKKLSLKSEVHGYQGRAWRSQVQRTDRAHLQGGYIHLHLQQGRANLHLLRGAFLWLLHNYYVALSTRWQTMVMVYGQWMKRTWHTGSRLIICPIRVWNLWVMMICIFKPASQHGIVQQLNRFYYLFKRYNIWPLRDHHFSSMTEWRSWRRRTESEETESRSSSLGESETQPSYSNIPSPLNSRSGSGYKTGGGYNGGHGTGYSGGASGRNNTTSSSTFNRGQKVTAG